MPEQQGRGRIDVDRADWALIRQAAAQLWRGAILAGYAGLEHKEMAFALALVLDEIARHISDLDDDLRAAVVMACREISR